jgi:pilus assembly protein Flp/PilA
MCPSGLCAITETEQNNAHDRRGMTKFIQENTMSFLKAFLKDESGATMIEYGLVAALVSVAAIIALQLLGAQLQTVKGGTETCRPFLFRASPACRENGKLAARRPATNIKRPVPPK